jgi:hypothetical protein
VSAKKHQYQEAMPCPTRLTAWGTLDDFYHKDFQSILDKWYPRIPAEKIIEVTFFLCRLSNVTLRPDLWEEDKQSRASRFMRFYFQHPAFFAELLWKIETLNAVPLSRLKKAELLALAERDVAAEGRTKSEQLLTALAAKASEWKGQKIARGYAKNWRTKEIERRRKIGEKWNLRIAEGNKKSEKV